MSGFMALMQPQFVLMSVTLDTMEDRGGRAVQSWPWPHTCCNTRKNWFCPSPTEALRRGGSYMSPGHHNRAEPVCRDVAELALRAQEC